MFDIKNSPENSEKNRVCIYLTFIINYFLNQTFTNFKSVDKDSLRNSQSP